MTQMTAPPDKLGAPARNKPGHWVQTERKAHEAWANLIAKKPRAAMLLHHLVAQMGHQMVQKHGGAGLFGDQVGPRLVRLAFGLHPVPRLVP
ncbi:hypothetical protein, partial [Escherichia coli]|uniref:hypothetical protein n=1 Tax=Escherichia coli TaxID=562 RepID=UPI0028746369